MSGKGDFKVGDLTPIGLGTDEVRALPVDAHLGFFAAQEGRIGGLSSSHGDAAAQQQGEITVAVVQADTTPAVKGAAPAPRQKLGGDFDFDDHTPIGGFAGAPNLDL